MAEVQVKKKVKGRKRKIFTGIVFFLFCVGLLVFLFSGDNLNILKGLFTEDITKGEVRELLSQLGVKGYVTIGILSMLQVILTFLPAEPVQVAAGISFGLETGTWVCLAGVFVGNTILYILYKIYGSKVSNSFHHNVEFDFEAARRSKRVALIIFILYFLPAIPYGLICLFAASLDVKYPRYILLTTIGAIPSILIGVGLGHVAIASSWIVSFIVLIVLLTLLIVLYKNKAKVFAKVNEFIRKHAYSSATAVRKCSKPLLRTMVFGSRFVLDPKIKIRLQNEVGKLEEPALVLCNHGSFLDFAYVGRMLKKEDLHFIGARLYFYHKTLAGLIRRLGAFPKSMFSNDVESTKNCMRVFNMNGTLAMMPEARLSTVGKFEGIQEQTYKFIQRSDVATYAIKINGAYFAKPKWGDKIRKGALVEAKLVPLFKAGEAKTLSFDELKKRIDDAVSYDEWEWLETKPALKYKSKTLAKGLENILCQCPNCGTRYAMTAKKRTLTCEACGMSATVDDRYGFVDQKPFENFAKWYEWQTQEMEKEILADPDFKLESKVVLKHSSNDGKRMLRVAGEGVCTLNRQGLTYRGTRDGEAVEKFFPMSVIYRLLFGAGVDFEIYEGKEIWFFVPENTRSCVAWYIASGILKTICEE